MRLFHLRRAYALLAAVVAIAAVLSNAILAYRSLFAFGFKTEAESALFTALIAAIVIIVSVSAALAASAETVRRLHRLAELTALSGAIPQNRLRALGDLGEAIARVSGELERISEEKTHKIRAQNELIERLLDVTDEPLLVVDKRLVITKANASCSRIYHLEEGSLLNRPLASIFPDLTVTGLDRMGNEENTEEGSRGGEESEKTLFAFGQGACRIFLLRPGSKQRVGVETSLAAPEKTSFRLLSLFSRRKRG